MKQRLGVVRNLGTWVGVRSSSTQRKKKGIVWSYDNTVNGMYSLYRVQSPTRCHNCNVTASG